MFIDDILILVVNHLSYTDRLRLLCTTRQFSRVISLWLNTKLVIASFDIGRVNFAQYVERCDITKLKELRSKDCDITHSRIRDKWNKSEAEMEYIMNNVCLNGERLHIGVYNFKTGNAVDSTKLDKSILINFFEHMNNYKWLWDQCDVFLIEKQFINMRGPSKGTNYGAIKLEAITYGWFVEHYPSKFIVNIGSSNKTQIFGCKGKMNKTQRKKWATEKATDIFTRRKDNQSIQLYDLPNKIKRKRMNKEEKIQSYLSEFIGYDSDIYNFAETILRTRQKMDDVSDALVQSQAFKYLTFVST